MMKMSELKNSKKEPSRAIKSKNAQFFNTYKRADPPQWSVRPPNGCYVRKLHSLSGCSAVPIEFISTHE